MTKFADCFWGADFNSTAGFDTLCKRMRDGRQMCHDFEDFIRQRAEAEEKYGKALIKLAESAKGKEEIGSLRESWEVLKTETENIGKAHVGLAQQLIEELEKTIQNFREMQREKRKKVEESVKRSQRNKRNCFDSSLKLKRTYEQKCREHDTADDALKKSVSLVSKDEEKLRSRLGRAKTAVEQADTAYQNSVRSLEDARDVWEKEMEVCCNFFQGLEEERISFLRNAMWVYTNTSSLNCVKVDAICEEIRKSLEKCAVESDIHLFVNVRKTGKERPARIEYENYYMSQSSQKIVSPSSAVNISVPVPGTFQHVQTKEPVGMHGPPKSSALRRPPLQLPDTPSQDPTDDSMYSTVNETSRPREVRIKELRCRAQFDYEAQGDQELSFKAGDLIKISYKENETWWCGEVHGRKGMFPKDFVELVKP